MRTSGNTITVRFTIWRLMAEMACFAVPMAMVHEAIYGKQGGEEFSGVTRVGYGDSLCSDFRDRDAGIVERCEAVGDEALISWPSMN